MKNDYPKIGKIKVQIFNDCNSTEKQILDLYWRMEENMFIGTVKSIYTKHGFTQYEFSKLAQSKSSVVLYTFCEECISYERHLVYSRSSFIQIINDVKRAEKYTYNHYRGGYANSSKKCACCKEIENQKRYEEQKAQEERLEFERKEKLKNLLNRLRDAIENKHWERLSIFELQVFCKCIETDFEGVKKHSGKVLGQSSFKRLINVMYKLADLDLLLIHKYDNGFISHYEQLKELQNYENEIRELIKEKQLNNVSRFEREETDVLKFKLTINEMQKHPDSPKFAGVVTFQEEIRLQPNIEYTFGSWERANDHLYLTLIPTEQIELAPVQTRVSKQPKHIQKAIQNFLNNMGKGIS